MSSQLATGLQVLAMTISLTSQAKAAEPPWGWLTLRAPASAPVLSIELDGAGVVLGRDGGHAAVKFCRERGYRYVNLCALDQSAAFQAAVSRVHGIHALVLPRVRNERSDSVFVINTAAARQEHGKRGPWLMRPDTCVNGLWVRTYGDTDTLCHPGRPIQLADSSMLVLVNHQTPELTTSASEHIVPPTNARPCGLGFDCLYALLHVIRIECGPLCRN
jgi:hypothetical protein